MTEKHPYAATQGHIIQIVSQFRKSFPSSVNADTLKKLGIAPNNESRLINVLKFLGFLDQDGAKTEAASKVFSIHDDTKFNEAFSQQIAESYKELFELHGQDAWTLGSDGLINFFRANDSSSDSIGKKQASTFSALAKMAGHGDTDDITLSSSVRVPQKKNQTNTTKAEKTKSKDNLPGSYDVGGKRTNDIGLTVRIEINLPSDGEQETYDMIFRSIRENLINE